MKDDPRNLSEADWMFERIIRTLKGFEEGLTAEEEVGLRFAAFPGEALSIENVGYWNPDMIKFYGRTGDGHRYEIVQHTSQVSLLLVALPKRDNAPRRIGFNLAEQLKKTRRSAAT